MRALVFITTALLAFINYSAASTLTPPVLPLIVRNPYLSTWLVNAREKPWKSWPAFWTGNSVSWNWDSRQIASLSSCEVL